MNRKALKIGFWSWIILIILWVLSLIGSKIIESILSFPTNYFLTVEGVLGFGGLTLIILGSRSKKTKKLGYPTVLDDEGPFTTDEEGLEN